jgi:putative SOS response-associated peptidase YedK
MCGRFTYLFSWPELCRLMGLLASAGPPRGFGEGARRYNIAPTQEALVVRRAGDGPREAVAMRWGLVPWWADDLSFGNRAINARSESAARKPAFREAFARRRCLVPASGFYEWEKVSDGKTKQPWYVKPGGDGGCAFAGLWERWRPKDAPEGEAPVETFTILTTKANPMLAPVHDRMPVVIAPERFEEWLDPAVEDAGKLKGLLASRDWPEAEVYAVSTHVNRPANEDPLCVRPIDVGRRPGEGGVGEAGLFG